MQRTTYIDVKRVKFVVMQRTNCVLQRTTLWYIDVKRVKFVVNATYYTVIHRCKKG